MYIFAKLLRVTPNTPQILAGSGPSPVLQVFSLQRQEAELAQQMNSEREREAEQLQKQEEKRREEMMQYQRELKQQLQEIEDKKQEAYEEFLKEKLKVDEIIRKIYEEVQM